MMSLVRNKLQEELLYDLIEKGETKRLNEYVWQNGKQRYRAKFAIKTMQELTKKLEDAKYAYHLEEGKNGGRMTARIVQLPF